MLMTTKFPPFKPAHGIPGYDGNAPEFMPARDIHSRDRMTGKVVRETPDGPENVNSTRVRSMHVRKRLTDRQAAAGDRYAADWQLSQAQVIATAGVVNSGSSARSTLADARLDAMTRWGNASAAIPKICRAGVELVVLKNMLLEVVASILKMHHQKVAGLLECGLEALADHYGIGE